MGAPTVRVLGELLVDGVDARSLADRKARLVLRILALARGRSIGTAALAEAVWGEAPPARPADQIAVLISRLRKALGRDAIQTGDDGYRLAYEWLDLDELADLTAEAERRHDAGNASGAVTAARVAIGLVRGPVPAPPVEVDWVRADIEATHRLVQRARRVAAAAMLDAGEWPDALDLAAADLQTDPYDEAAARLVMRAHVAAARPSVALATYANLRRTLADELGADPAPETTALNAAILRGEAVAEPVRVEAEPGLVGRLTELARLDALAAAAAHGPVDVVAVLGEAGIGKTTLVSAWARRRAGAGDTVLFGTCGALDRSAPLDVVLGAIAEHLRRSPDAEALLGEDRGLLGPLLGSSLGAGAPRPEPDPVLGLASLYGAITSVLDRIAGESGAIVVIDDAHLAGSALADWARFALRRPARLLVVAASRPAEGTPFPATTTLTVAPLDLAETAELVGHRRADDLHARSGGNPLFLSELMSSTVAAEEGVPLSLVAIVEQRCDQLGTAADVLRTAAVLGTGLDVDLLASVLGRPPLEVLADIELAEDRGLLVERAGRHTFRHELVRDALASGARAGRTALLHREAGRILARRPSADPVVVAEHARLGGDLEQAARSLRTAAARAAEQFDHETAESLLDQSLALDPTDDTRLERARVRVRRGRYAEAQDDVEAAADAGAEGWEVGAWAAYFDRRFDDAVRFARNGELATDDAATRARCLTVGGRTLHARGDLVGAEERLTAAVETAEGRERVTAAAWLGVLRAHRSEHQQALELLGPVTHPGSGAELTSATLHALLFTGHAHALAGRPAAALSALGRYTDEVGRRQVPRFSGRGVNMSGWVLRSVGAQAEAVDAHQEAREVAVGKGRTEMHIAACEDLAEESLRVGDVDGADRLLDEAEAQFAGDLVFGWRLALKLATVRARLALAVEHPEQALSGAEDLLRTATGLGVPRYSSVARLLVHQANAALGVPVDLDAAARDLVAVEETVRLEAWWWAGETGAALGSGRLLDRAETLADELAAASGPYGTTLRGDAGRRLADWRLRTR